MYPSRIKGGGVWVSPYNELDNEMQAACATEVRRDLQARLPVQDRAHPRVRVLTARDDGLLSHRLPSLPTFDPIRDRPRPAGHTASHCVEDRQ